MKFVKPKLGNVNLGEGQKEYNTLPAYRKDTPEVEVVCKVELSEEEIKKIVETKTIYYSQWTFGDPFHPIMLSVFEEQMYTQEELEKADEGNKR